MDTTRIAIVTGGTSGIGRVTAHALAAAGSTVIIAARDPKRGEATVEEIRTRTGNTSVVFTKVDLSSQESIREFARAFRKKYARLDVLVNNAGALNSRRSITVDGLETTFATNHLGPFLLTNLLLDVLKASAPSRIVNVASMAARSGVIKFEDLQGEHAYAGDACVLPVEACEYRVHGRALKASAGNRCDSQRAASGLRGHGLRDE